ncbi:molybdopterin oxidoreductase family protein [Limnobacter sp.]|uniref:molybdopterin oxidoreductase family protein n=1 Tax=Limnobacter sp. TaxID=2003368 RepID=UPI00374909C4
MQTYRRACHLCEAICGLKIEVENNQVVSIKGDEQDPFSRGHICPKAVALKDIQEDPDRLTKPVKKVDGQWVETTWEDAIELACEGLFQVQQKYGANAVGVYQGNPNVHNWGLMTHSANFLGLLKTRNRFSATSVDQLPMQLLGYWMFGHQLLITIPDIDHTNYFLMLGANPIASNGSLMTVPDVAKRIKALQARGGKLVLIDPRKTETAQIADSHHFIKPASDAAFVFALINTIVGEGLTRMDRLAHHSEGLYAALGAISKVTPEVAQAECGIDAETIRQIARDFANAGKAVAYGRMGACTQRHGTLAQWGIQLLNFVTGNTDRVGGSLVANPALDLIAAPNSKPGSYGRWHSRVSQKPEALGEFPSAIMAEEIQTEGEGQIKAMVTIAGNPVLSTPNGQQLDKAITGLDFMVSVDLYINETNRHADVILPTTSPLEHDHYDLIFNIFGVRNQAKYSAATLPKPEGSLDDWELMDKLAACYSAKLGKPARPLIGRRHIRSNNSWMHNSERLVKGKNRCTAMVNPADAARLNLQEGHSVRVRSRVGEITLSVEISEDVMPSVVSIPHGWGHDKSGIRLQVAAAHAGVSCNDLTDEQWLDEPSGNAAVNGVPVTLIPVP